MRIYRKQQLLDLLESAGLTCISTGWAHALHSPYWWLKCAVGLDNDGNPAVRAYHRFLTWDITHAPRLTRTLERVLNPVLGKSLVLYADRGDSEDGGQQDEVAAA